MPARGPPSGAGPPSVAAPARPCSRKASAVEFLADEADDRLAAPDVVAKKIGYPLEIGAPAGDAIAEVEPTVTERRVRQAGGARLSEAERLGPPRGRSRGLRRPQ